MSRPEMVFELPPPPKKKEKTCVQKNVKLHVIIYGINFVSLKNFNVKIFLQKLFTSFKVVCELINLSRTGPHFIKNDKVK